MQKGKTNLEKNCSISERGMKPNFGGPMTKTYGLRMSQGTEVYMQIEKELFYQKQKGKSTYNFK